MKLKIRLFEKKTKEYKNWMNDWIYLPSKLMDF